jgi:hypothetical protein
MVTLTKFSYPVETVLVSLLSNILKLFGFPIFQFWANLMKIIVERRRAQSIWYARFSLLFSNWLIVGSSNYFLYIHDENKSNNI